MEAIAAQDVQTQLIAPAAPARLDAVVPTESEPESTSPTDEGNMTLTRARAVDVTDASQTTIVEPGETQLSACPQDLVKTRGIGAVFEQRLYGGGIGTYWQLAQLSDDDFRRILGLNELQLSRLDFNDIRAHAFRLAQETNSVGRVWEGTEPDDFEPLEGIGGVYEGRLYDAGICTFEALANATVERLMELCPPTKLRRPDYASWIAQAKQRAEQKRS